MIVGATADATATLDMRGGASIQAGSLFGIGHDGTNSTGATGNGLPADNASITAATLFIGANGCLGGNGGVIHGNVIMDGATGYSAAIRRSCTHSRPRRHPAAY